MNNQLIEIQHSCLTDKPLDDMLDDKLNSSQYAQALSKFILNADTPVTLGIQGGWGSGKTSLFYLLDKLLAKTEHRAITIKINAWEHSLFQTNDNKAMVVLSILNSMINGIVAIGQQAWLDKDAQKFFRSDQESGLLSKLTNATRKMVPMIMNLGLSYAGFPALAGHAAEKDNNAQQDPELPILAEQIHNLKENLKNYIKHIRYKGANGPEQCKIVIFIDDLDRVPPPTAVEILDVTKNIFDIPNCVFVLAIDYEVIVKGLENKFGKRTNKNEREFRQYFDKIIQIPFTMPVGAFSRQINKMLEKALNDLDYSLDEENKSKLIANLSKVIKLSTGGIPRSIKRILNTFSLLDYIALEKNETIRDDPKLTQQEKLHNLEARFIIVALHVSYPEICRRLMEKPDFTGWNLDALNIPWDLNKDKNEQQIQNLANSNLAMYFDESWEQVAYCLCSQDAWLKKNAVNISRLLNMLRDALLSTDEEDGHSEESAEERWNEAQRILGDLLEGIRVISIDNDLQTQAIGNQQVQEGLLTGFARQVWRRFTDTTPGIKPKASTDTIHACWNEDRDLHWEIEIEGEPDSFNIMYHQEDAWLEIWWTAWRYGLTMPEAREIIGDLEGTGFRPEYYGRRSNGCYMIVYDVNDFEMQTCKREDFIEETANKAAEAYKLCRSLAKKMEKAAG